MAEMVPHPSHIPPPIPRGVRHFLFLLLPAGAEPAVRTHLTRGQGQNSCGQQAWREEEREFRRDNIRKCNGYLLLSLFQIKGERSISQSDCQGKARGHGHQLWVGAGCWYAHIIATLPLGFLCDGFDVSFFQSEMPETSWGEAHVSFSLCFPTDVASIHFCHLPALQFSFPILFVKRRTDDRWNLSLQPSQITGGFGGDTAPLEVALMRRFLWATWRITKCK